MRRTCSYAAMTKDAVQRRTTHCIYFVAMGTPLFTKPSNKGLWFPCIPETIPYEITGQDDDKDGAPREDHQMGKEPHGCPAVICQHPPTAEGRGEPESYKAQGGFC